MFSSWFFTYDGIEGLAERHGGSVYIYWAGMGFHYQAASFDLARAIRDGEPSPKGEFPIINRIITGREIKAANSGAAMAS